MNIADMFYIYFVVCAVTICGRIKGCDVKFQEVVCKSHKNNVVWIKNICKSGIKFGYNLSFILMICTTVSTNVYCILQCIL